jgi:hypothetical protein
MNLRETKDYLYKKLPMPRGCEFYGEGGYPHEFPGGIAVRRNLFVNVTDRLPQDAPRHAGLDADRNAQLFYRRFNEDLIEDFWKQIELVCTEPARRTTLGGADEQETFVYFSREVAVTIRGRFDKYHLDRLIWIIDFVAVVTPLD